MGIRMLSTGVHVCKQINLSSVDRGDGDESEVTVTGSAAECLPAPITGPQNYDARVDVCKDDDPPPDVRCCCGSQA
jgi:hypothetical protein